MSNLKLQAVNNFIEYLRIKTVQPTPDYGGAVEFLKRMAAELKLPCQVIECIPGKPIVIMTWEGADPTLPSIVLNSHTDVVPVYPEFWRHEPFSAYKEENGDIYCRGTQDMKCVTIQYLEAIRRLKMEGKYFLRTIHLTFVPDEEIGGIDGMEAFLDSPEFKKLNLGLALDEGLANPNDAYTVYYGERYPFWIEVNCPGKPGHGSRFIENNAAEKLRKVLNSFLEYRDNQERRLKTNPSLKLGDVTTINLTILQGGVQENVVPPAFSAKFDIRIAATENLDQFKSMIDQWCHAAGPDVYYTFKQIPKEQVLTPITRDDSWWNAFMTSMDRLGCKIETEIFPAATDSRFLRQRGYPAIGFSPMKNTPILLHDHNEFLNEKVFLNGIDVYVDLIPQLANVPGIEN